MNNLYFKTPEIRENMINVEKSITILKEETNDMIDMIINQHGKPKKDLSVLYYISQNN